jgi:hypothetical protein
MKNKISVVDNFLDSEIFYKIQKEFMSRQFPWYYQNTVVDDSDEEKLDPDVYQFTHIIWSISDGGVLSKYFDIIRPIVKKLNAISILKIKSNLLTKKENPKYYKYHRDFVYPTAKTSILYLNTNNGTTIFKNGEEIKSVENRLVTFDNSLYHTGKSCTDKSVRVLLNFNYFDY